MGNAGTTMDLADSIEISDERIVERVRQGEMALFEVIMRRHNRRLYRIARAIVGDDSEAEDVMQEAYVRAYANLEQFAGRARFGTWLIKIMTHEALARVRRRGRFVDLEEHMSVLESPSRGPEQTAADRELRAVLEQAVNALPEAFRATFMLRDVEGLTTAEAAACLDVPEETVKTRLHRARAALRRTLRVRVGESVQDIFPFGLERCDRVVTRVLARIRVATSRA